MHEPTNPTEKRAIYSQIVSPEDLPGIREAALATGVSLEELTNPVAAGEAFAMQAIRTVVTSRDGKQYTASPIIYRQLAEKAVTDGGRIVVRLTAPAGSPGLSHYWSALAAHGNIDTQERL